MERAIFRLVRETSDEQIVTGLVAPLEQGWVLDPELKVVRLDNMAIYHLIKYEEGEEPTGEEELTLVSMKSVDINDVDNYLEKGYVVTAKYAKTATVEKYEKKEEVKEDE